MNVNPTRFLLQARGVRGLRMREGGWLGSLFHVDNRSHGCGRPDREPFRSDPRGRPVPVGGTPPPGVFKEIASTEVLTARDLCLRAGSLGPGHVELYMIDYVLGWFPAGLSSDTS